MATAELTSDGKIRLKTAYREKILVDKVPGSRFNYDDECWYVPLSWGSAWALHGVFGDALTVGEELKAWTRRELENRVAPAMNLRGLPDLRDPEDPLFDTALYPFQRVGTRFLVTAERALLADEMGTGKTVQAIHMLNELGSEGLPMLIVCPNSMVETWKMELARWAGDELRVTTLVGNVNQRREIITSVALGETDVLITNWEKLRLHSRLAPYGSIALKRCSVCQPATEGKPLYCEHCLKELNNVEWQFIVADEAHRMKSPKAKQTRALWWLGRGVKYKLAMTGTPISSSPEDLWSLMHFVAPEDWPRKTSFIDRYCLSSWNPWGTLEIVGLKPQTKEEFFRILDPRFIRRTKAMVLPQLPPKIYTTRYVTLSTKQARAYKELAKTMLAELDNGLAAVTNPLTRMQRLLQLTSAFAAVGEEASTWELTTPSTKLDALFEIIEESGDQQIAVFAESRRLIELAEKLLLKAEIPYASIHGNIIPVERQEAIRRLNDGEIKVLLLTLGAGGEGLTLTAASTIVFLERSYSMVKNKQAEDRLHRIGQTAEHVEVIDIIASNTMDELRLDAVGEKEMRLEEVVRDEASLRRYLEELRP